MLNKTQLAWSVATVAFIAATGLGGALYRTHKASEKQQEIISYLRDEQTKIGTLSKEDKKKLASEVARLENELEGAQQAQRELTDQLFASEDDVEFLLQELADAEAKAVPEKPAEAAPSPFVTYIALRKVIASGKPYHTEWEALQQRIPNIDAAIAKTITQYADGMTSITELKHQLRETYESAHLVTQEDGVLSRLSDVISVRKIDKDDRKLKALVLSGDIGKAYDMVRDDAAYQDWVAQVGARRELLKALNALEQQLAGAHG